MNSLQFIIYIVSLYREGDIPEAILKGFLAVDSELKTYGNATELTGSTGILYKFKFVLKKKLDWQFYCDS